MSYLFKSFAADKKNRTLKRSDVGNLSLSKYSVNPQTCRCGGQPLLPSKVANCADRWEIKCSVKRCFAKNAGQGLNATIYGWNQLCSHVYR